MKQRIELARMYLIKLPVAEWKSIMAKLKNELSKQEIAAKRADRKEKKPDVK